MSGGIKILMTARALYDLEEARRIFREEGHEAYIRYMTGADDGAHDARVAGRRLNPGPAWDIVQAATVINAKHPGTIEIGIICKDSAQTRDVIWRNMDADALGISKRICTNGTDIGPEHAEAFGADLFLSGDAESVQRVIDAGFAAATVQFPPGVRYAPKNASSIAICVDGDCVAISDHAEAIFKSGALDDFLQHEFNKHAEHIEGKGPFTDFLIKATQLNRLYAALGYDAPFDLSLLTARGDSTDARALWTLDKLGIEFNAGITCISAAVSGMTKHGVLAYKRPHLFVDDGQHYMEPAAQHCVAGHVPYKTGSRIHRVLEQQKKNGERERKYFDPQNVKNVGHAPGKFRIFVSSRVVVDLQHADKIFHDQGLEEYIKYMKAEGPDYKKDFDPEIQGRRLQPGPMWDLVMAAKAINAKYPGTVEIGLVCKDVLGSMRVISRNADVHQLDIPSRTGTCGHPVSEENLKGFGADLFISRNAQEATAATDLGIAAVAVEFPDGYVYTPNTENFFSLLRRELSQYGHPAAADLLRVALEKASAIEKGTVTPSSVPALSLKDC